MPPLKLLPALFLLPALNGCVVWEIRDGINGTTSRISGVQDSLAETNYHLQDVTARLDNVTVRLDSVNGNLNNVNANLKDVTQRLDRVTDNLKQVNDRLDTVTANLKQVTGRLDGTNEKLDGLQDQLATLDSIDESLKHLDVHLAALRGTLNKLNDTIPFLDFGSKDPEPATGPASQPAERKLRVRRPTTTTAPATTQP